MCRDYVCTRYRVEYEYHCMYYMNMYYVTDCIYIILQMQTMICKCVYEYIYIYMLGLVFMRHIYDETLDAVRSGFPLFCSLLCQLPRCGNRKSSMVGGSS